MSASRAARRTPLMRVPEVADLFEVDPETIRVWVREGKLAARKNPGGRVLVFNRAEVEAFTAPIPPTRTGGPGATNTETRP